MFSKPICGYTFVCISFLGDVRESDQLSQNLFSTNKGINEYGLYLLDLKEELVKLRPEDHWIDLGAGQAKALYDYYESLKGQAQTTAIVYVKPEKNYIEQLPSNSKYLSGRFFEDIPEGEIARADLITDFYGVISYTHDLSGSLERAISLLKTNGILYIFNGYFKNTVIKKRSTTETLKYGIAEYLASIPGLIVEYQFNGRMVDDESPAIKITKTESFQDGAFAHLRLISLETYSAPPKRHFVWED